MASASASASGARSGRQAASRAAGRAAVWMCAIGGVLFGCGSGCGGGCAVVRLERAEVPVNGAIRLSVELANPGTRPGEEVVQVYAHRAGEDNPRLPRERLFAFHRTKVSAGGRAVVALTVPADALRRLNDMKVLTSRYDIYQDTTNVEWSRMLS